MSATDVLDLAYQMPGAACPQLIKYAPLLERDFGCQTWPALAGIGRDA